MLGIQDSYYANLNAIDIRRLENPSAAFLLFYPLLIMPVQIEHPSTSHINCVRVSSILIFLASEAMRRVGLGRGGAVSRADQLRSAAAVRSRFPAGTWAQNVRTSSEGRSACCQSRHTVPLHCEGFSLKELLGKRKSDFTQPEHERTTTFSFRPAVPSQVDSKHWPVSMYGIYELCLWNEDWTDKHRRTTTCFMHHEKLIVFLSWAVHAFMLMRVQCTNV